MFIRLATILIAVISVSALAQDGGAPQPARKIRHVVVISIDGLRPDVMLRADTPNLRSLMRRGSFTMWAKTTPQSITLPSHVSMLTGVSPSVHGIEWNADLPLAQAVYPARPTLFELAKAAGYTTALVAGKSKFSMLAPPQALDHVWIPSEPKCEDSDVLEHAIPMIRQNKPDVMFIHFPTVDSVGHGVGWGTREQIAAIANADACVGKVLAAINEIGRTDSTLIIVSSDHGGAGRTHGPDDARSRSIPWIAAGPGVRADYDLTRFGKDFDVQTYDTFATACYVLGLQPNRRIEGKPIREMFDDAELTKPVPNQPRTPATQVH